MPNGFCRVPVKIVLKYGERFTYDAYIKLSETKMVKLVKEGEVMTDVLARYHNEKGLHDIYVSQTDYMEFLKMVQADHLKDPDILENAFESLKDNMIELGLTEATITAAKQINQASVKLLQTTPNIFELFKKFSRECPEEFKKSLTVSFLCIAMVDRFLWGNQSIKEKCSLAALLCDINLNSKELQLIQEASEHLPLSPEEQKKLPSHPARPLVVLHGEDWIPSETLNMIEQHHEEPDGRGFPQNLTHHRISQLSAVFIVSLRFADLLFKHDFDFRKKNDMLLQIQLGYEVGVFKKATQALLDVLDGPKWPEQVA